MIRNKIPLILLTALAGLPLAARMPAQVVGDAVVNKFGFAVKGITKRKTRRYEEPDPKSGFRDFGMFKFVYILPPDPKATVRTLDKIGSLTENGFYRVARGNSESEMLGWIPKEDLEEWHHQQALGFTDRIRAKTKRALIPFFDAAEELEKFMAEKDAKMRAGLVAYEEPDSPYYFDKNKKRHKALVIMPALGSWRREFNGSEQKQFLTSFLAGAVSDTGPAGTEPDEAAPKPPEEPETPDPAPSGDEGDLAEQIKEASLDLVFVVDETASMEPEMEMLRRAIEKVSQTLKRTPSIARLRLGLVGYRDKGMAGHPRLLCNLEKGENIEVFQEAVKNELKDAEKSSQDYPEDVWAGISLALDRAKLKWSDGLASLPIVVVIGDASAHDGRHPKNTTKHTTATLLQKAQPTMKAEGSNPIMFFVQHIQRPGTESDHPVAADQFKRISEEAGFAGRYIASPSQVDFADRLSEQIIAQLKIPGAIKTAAFAQISDLTDQIDAMRRSLDREDWTELASLAGAVERGAREFKLPAIADAAAKVATAAGAKSGGEATDALAKLQDLARAAIQAGDPGSGGAAGGADPGAAQHGSQGIDKLRKKIQFQLTARKAKKGVEGLSFSKAYASEFNRFDERQFIPYIFVSKRRLASFKGFMQSVVLGFEMAGTPDSRNNKDILENLQMMTTNLNLGQKITMKHRLDKLLSMKLGLPIKSEVFKMSFADLKALGQDDWNRWVGKVREVEKTLEVILDDPSRWFPLAEGADTTHHHAFIKIADLP